MTSISARVKLFAIRARFKFMSDFSNKQINQPDGQVAMHDTDARQGQTGMGVRYVLAISLGAAIAVLALAYFLIGF
jgi:hypothetical protein